MDPQTGEVLAMASYPTFNPNEFNEANDSERRNRAVQDIYEPGSTFKVVTVAAALEEKLMPPDALIDTSPGIIRLPGNRIVDEFEGHNYGVLSLTQVIVKSSNVGAIKIGLRLGPERLGMYVNRFGFGRPTSPDFPGESPGIVWNPAKLNDGAVASISMGYQVGVTPLQMTAAMNTVANGGNWIEPRIVRAAIRDGVRTPITPKVTRRAISRRDGGAAHPDSRIRGRRWHRQEGASARVIPSPARPERRTRSSTAGTAARSRTSRSSASCRRAIRRLRSS